MNIALFGCILAWLGVIYCIFAFIAIHYHYKALIAIQQRAITFEMGIPLIILVVSVAYIATYCQS